MAEGSHATFSGYPKVCSICGQPVRITGFEPLVFEWTPKHGKRSWHVRCLKGGERSEPSSPIAEEETGAPTPPSGRTRTSPSGSAPTLAGPAPNEGDCALAGATAQPDGQTAVAPLYSPTSAQSPRNGGDMPETPEPPQPEPEPDNGGDEDE